MTDSTVTVLLPESVIDLINLHVEATGMTRSHVISSAIVQVYSRTYTDLNQESLAMIQGQIQDILIRLDALENRY